MTKRDERTVRRRPFLPAALVLAAMTALAARATERAVEGGATGDRDGQALYAKNCSSCHGDSGRGDGPSGLFLKEKPTDFRSGDVRKMSDDELFERITEGSADARFREAIERGRATGPRPLRPGTLRQRPLTGGFAPPGPGW